MPLSGRSRLVVDAPPEGGDLPLAGLLPQLNLEARLRRPLLALDGPGDPGDGGVPILGHALERQRGLPRVERLQLEIAHAPGAHVELQLVRVAEDVAEPRKVPLVRRL